MRGFVLFCCVWLSSPGGLLFSEGKRRGVNLRGWKLGRAWRSGAGETVVTMYCVRGESIYNLLYERERETTGNGKGAFQGEEKTWCNGMSIYL